MNINSKFQATPAQGQPNLQAQQILLQQLQQNQSQQQVSGSMGLAQFGQADSFGEASGQQGIYQNNYQRNQPPQLQQQFYPQQFQHQGQQNNQSAAQQLQFQSQQQGHPQIPQAQAQAQVPVPSQSNQQVFGQQSRVISQQAHQLQKPNNINIDNPNSIYWQHQLQLCQLSRASNIPHFYARQYASNSRKNKNPYSDVKSVNLIDATRTIVAALEEQERAMNSSISTPVSSSALLHNKKISIDDDQEEQRMRQKTHGKQLWCQIDLSGQGLVNTAPKLFQYDFLESLYLNNNKLTSVPSIINKLKGLRTLDLSQNRITEVPWELGLCFNLRYLYLFDNEIKTLPNEFGNLIELLFLGIEGNPMDLKIANLVSEKGTKELVSFLRDSNNRQKPEQRPWLLLEDDTEVVASRPDTSEDGFTMMSYNTLCQHYATPKMYKYTQSWALDWDFRRKALKDEILNHGTDLVCLQEVETKTFHEFWVPLLAEHGYKGAFYSKTRSKTMSEAESKKVDGCATFYKTESFTLLSKQNFEYNSVCMGSDKYKKTKDLFNRFMNKDNIALITFLQHNKTGEKIVVVNTHLHWDPAYNDVKALQIGILLEELQGIMKKYHHANSVDEVKNASLMICGDFNSVKESAVSQLFSSGHVTKHDDLEGRDYGRFTDEGFFHSFKLKSAYEHVGELDMTNFTPAFTDVIDYIWYSTPTLQVKGLLGKVDQDYLKHCIGFPDAYFPSDHIPLVTQFQIKKPSAKKQSFKVDFKTGTSRKT